MNTVKIYKVACHEAPQIGGQGIRYSLAPWGKNTLYYKGEDDGGKDYLLPEGYEAAQTATGALAIFDPKGRGQDILTLGGRPAIMDLGTGKTLWLKAAAQNEAN